LQLVKVTGFSYHRCKKCWS